MRTITVEVENERDVDEAFSIILQELDDARIVSIVTVQGGDAHSGTASIRPSLEGLPSGG